jgi:hypothetical protein
MSFIRAFVTTPTNLQEKEVKEHSEKKCNTRIPDILDDYMRFKATTRVRDQQSKKTISTDCYQRIVLAFKM